MDKNNSGKVKADNSERQQILLYHRQAGKSWFFLYLNKINLLHKAVRNVMSHMRDPEKGVLRLGLHDTDASRGALQALFNLVPNDTDSGEVPVKKTQADKPILAVIQHWHTKGKRYALLYAVNEDDCDWRTADDNSELSHDWDVISWTYLPPLM